MSGHIGGDGFLGWLGPYSPDNSGPIQDALAELEMAAWVISSLVNGHITGRELPDCHVGQ